MSFQTHYVKTIYAHVMSQDTSKFMIMNIICDTIKGNESLVENSNFYFLTPLSHNLKILHFDANPITIGYLVTEL